jgi:hypothetical protein
MASLEDFEKLDFSEFETFKTPTEKEIFSDILEGSRIEGSTTDISEHPRSEDFPEDRTTNLSRITENSDILSPNLTLGKNFETDSEESCDFESGSEASFEDGEEGKSFEEESSSSESSHFSKDSVESEGSIKSDDESEEFEDDLSSEESEESSFTESLENSVDSEVTQFVFVRFFNIICF